MKRSIRYLRLSAVVAAVALTVTACETDGDAGGDGEYDIPVVLKTTTSAYWLQVKGGVEDAAADLDIEAPVGGASQETEVQEQIDRVQSDLARDPDAIVVSPTQAEQLEPVLQEASSTGVPVILLDTDIEGWDGAETFVGTDNYGLGQEAGAWIEEQRDTAEMLVIRGVPGNPSTDDRIDGAIDELEGSDLELVAELAGDSDRAEARAATADALQSHPGLDTIFAANDDMALGAIEAVRGADMDLDDFLIVGVDGNEDAIESIRDGELDATLAQGAYDMGYEAVELAIQVIEGESLERENPVDTTLVTEDNAEEFHQQLEDQAAD